jgi:hypothetical protein
MMRMMPIMYEASKGVNAYLVIVRSYLTAKLGRLTNLVSK